MAQNPPITDWRGKTVWLIGASSGIGLATAAALHERGAQVVVSARQDALLQDFVVAHPGARARALDVTDADAVAQGIQALETAGALDILVNNAGIQIRGPLHEFAHSDWHTLMKTNLDSAFLVGQAVARHMISRGRGKIINICSVQSELGRPGIAPYTASKGALKMLTKGMAIDWGPLGLNVNGIGPGYFRTELTEKLAADPQFTSWLVGRTPSRRWGDVEDLGGAVVFLASDASRFVNGHILYVDGGLTATL